MHVFKSKYGQFVSIPAGRLTSRRRHDQWRDSETLRQFAPLSDISQGSVATHLRGGEIFNDITDYPLL